MLLPPILANFSDFARHVAQRDADWLQRRGEPPARAPSLSDLWQACRAALRESTEPPFRALARVRRRESFDILWRDVVHRQEVHQTLLQSSSLATAVIRAGLELAEKEFEDRHGLALDSNGAPVTLTVLGLGKLGGQELNFSSDVDLVFAIPREANSERLASERYFLKLARRLIEILETRSDEGFPLRVDMRLRPYGGMGALVTTFSAAENYFQREGRSWERFAWIKASVVAGDHDNGEELLQRLNPFVYRRYLDFSMLDAVEQMREMLREETRRQDAQGDLKRGLGGIRECEFIVQALQLLRGGRHPELQQPNFLRALARLRAERFIPAATADSLGEAYRFLRLLENRVQQHRDEQTHRLPTDPQVLDAIAASCGLASARILEKKLHDARGQVEKAFSEVFASPMQKTSAESSAYEQWLAQLPEAQANEVRTALTSLEKDLEAAARSRAEKTRIRRFLDSIDTTLVELGPRAADALHRCHSLLTGLARRSTYLLMLARQPKAQTRMFDLCTQSRFITELLEQQPALLEDLVVPPALQSDCDAVLAELNTRTERYHPDDKEAIMRELAETKQSTLLAAAIAVIERRIDTHRAATVLTAHAQAQIAKAVSRAASELASRHGQHAGMRFLVLGFGSLGAQEMHFRSDVDLVFLFDDGDDDSYDHAVRLSRKIITELSTLGPSGRLYEIDQRLRPDGKAGQLVSSWRAFASYQIERAWTWEVQALVRARPIAGDTELAGQFHRLRQTILRRPRSIRMLRDEIASMRRRLLSTSDDTISRAKTDLDFLAQFGVLAHAHRWPELASRRSTGAALHALDQLALLPHGSAHLSGIFDRVQRIRIERQILDNGNRELAAEDQRTLERLREEVLELRVEKRSVASSSASSRSIGQGSPSS